MDVRPSTSRLLLAMLFLAVSACSTAPRHTAPMGGHAAHGGAEVAADLTSRYNDKADNCGNEGRPAFLCSGVIIRGTGAFSTAFHSWNPSPNDQGRQSVSTGFLRRDMNFSHFGIFGYDNGIVFYPAFGGPADKFDLDIRCFFPLDGGTTNRTDHGCGAYPGVAGGEECASQNVKTADQWLRHYRLPVPNPQTHMCGFNVSEGTWDSALHFRQLPLIMAAHPKPYGEGNELVVQAWPQNSHRTVPIEAFFYRAGNTSGLANARNVQKDFYDTSSRDGTPIVVPIIAVTMPATEGASAVFTFNPADQVVR